MFEQSREFKVLHKTNPLTKSTGTSIPTIITTSRSTTTPITSTTTAFTLFLVDLTHTNSTTTITTICVKKSVRACDKKNTLNKKITVKNRSLYFAQIFFSYGSLLLCKKCIFPNSEKLHSYFTYATVQMRLLSIEL